MTTSVPDIGRPSINALRSSVRQLLGAERRLRRRSQGSDERLTYAQLLTLAVVARNPGETASEVARIAGLDPGSLTTVLDQLESRGVIERSRNPANRRAYVISLTPGGRDLVVPALTRWVARWDQQLSGFSDAELTAAAQVVAVVADVFDSMPSAEQ
jgi:MarR family transcriptional regulator, transcriptional regulator for hemolysin